MAELTYLPYLQIKGDHELKKMYTMETKTDVEKRNMV